MTARLAELYREAVLANAARPVGHGAELEATHRAEGSNPLCGDEVVMRLRVEADQILGAAFDGEACAICLASASLLCAHLPGHGTGAAAAILAAFRSDLRGAGAGAGECPGFLAPLLGVRAYPARVACATLPWETAVTALRDRR